ncbi:DUF1236 domain-containing protein [Devosia nitrariae]|uniref:DUF1236 domain-containing protein n=1 Tax=Devosia nitrariae TaxID=2071872 RepID=A0ABQ5W842_9HYPH|nr:DUF1236 domain-containing protein [Devosia nitrariae]GLQ55931.1 hypothetical protein GCM10010862_31900 [Devosia nitrariae]
MKKLLLASVAILALGSVSSLAQDAGVAVGGSAGGATGAGVGFLLGGPVGAAIGGFAGAVIGAEAGIEASTIEYAAVHPVAPIYVQAPVNVGYIVPPEVAVYPIEGDPAYSYIYVNNRIWLVDNQTRTLVHSPGYLVTQTSADFVTTNPVGSVTVEGDVVVGYVVPEDVELITIPDDPTYSYVYLNDRPVLVDNATRTIVWVN